MIEYKRANYEDEKTINELIALSFLWTEENCTNGLRPNTREDLNEPCYIAVDDGKIAGYIFGHYYDIEKNFSFAEAGTHCFFIDELYVLPNYRSKGIGRKLFAMIEEEVKTKADFIDLATSTKDWRRVLRFYEEETGMSFHDAFLYKSLK